MASVLNFSEAATIGLHAVCVLAAEPERHLSAREIATALDVSEAHLSKVLQRILKAGIVLSVRGPKGGFRLKRKAEKLSLLEVYEAVEGPLERKTCLLGKSLCKGTCILGTLLEDLGDRVRDHLARARVADLAGGFRRKPGKR